MLGSLAIGAGTSLLGGILGGREAARRQREANRVEKYNQMMGALNTQFSGLAPQLSQSRGIQQQQTPSREGNIMKGILSGVQTGLSAYGALNKQRDVDDWRKALGAGKDDTVGAAVNTMGMADRQRNPLSGIMPSSSSYGRLMDA